MRSDVTSPRSSTIGRQRELAEIQAAIDDEFSVGCVISGGIGVGKTHLARLASQEAEQRGFTSARVLATRSARNVPLGALAALVPECAAGPRALQEARQALLAIATDKPLLLTIDDAHLLDEVSSALLASIASEPSVKVLVTVLAGAPVHDAVTALWKDLGGTLLPLGPMPPNEIAQLARRLAREELSPEFVDHVVHLSQGRPLFLRELLRGTWEAAGAQEHDGKPEIPGQPTDTIDLPTSMIDLVRGHLSQMEPELVELVQLLALCEPLPVRVVELLGLSDELSHLEEAGLLRTGAGGFGAKTPNVVPLGMVPPVAAVQLDHAVYADVALEQIDDETRSLLLKRAANALESCYSDDHSHTRAVLWRQRSGEQVASDQLLEAARHCYQLGDYERCGELAGAAWAGHPTPTSGHLYGFALSRGGECEHAAEVMAVAAELATDDRDRVLLALARAENRSRGLQDPVGAEEICLAAEREITDTKWRAEVVAHRAMGTLQAGLITAALDDLEPLLDPDEVGGRAFVRAAYAAGMAFTRAGRGDDATRVALQALPIHEAIWVDDVFETEPGVHHLTTLGAMITDGRLADLEPLLDVARRLTASAIPAYAYAWICWLSGLTALQQGRCSAAIEYFETAIPRFEAGRFGWSQALCQAGAAAAAAMSGDEAAAKGYIRACSENAPSHRHLGTSMIDLAQGWLKANDDDLAGAVRCFVKGAEDALARGDLAGALHLTLARARCGDTSGALPAMMSLADRMNDALATDLVGYVKAFHDPDPDPAECGELAATFEGRGMPLEAAELYALAARRHHQNGATRAAARCESLAQGLRSTCPEAFSPTLDGALPPVDLTERELEIARLAAQRLTSKEIAAELGISVRTVDNHLSAVYRKLQVSSRADLAVAMGAPISDK